MKKLCNAFVYWWNGEYEGECELSDGHEGPHYDGLSWYVGDGRWAEEVDPSDYYHI